MKNKNITSSTQAFFFLCILILIITFFHLGSLSPYTYLHDLFKHGSASSVEGIPTNWDTPSILYFLDFFAMGKTDFLAQSMAIKIPLYEFLLSIIWRMTHHLFLSVLLLNLTALFALNWIFCKITAKYGFDFLTTITAGTLFLTLLWVSHYMGQPLPYIVGVSLAFSIILFLILEPEKSIRPWQDGFLLAILYLTYDAYPYLLAFFLYAWKMQRYHSKRDYFFAGVSFILPMLGWYFILKYLSPTGVNAEEYQHFMLPAIQGWFGMLNHLLLNLYLIGATTFIVVYKQVMAQIYWPFLFVCMYWILKYRHEWQDMPRRFYVMAASLLVSYLFLQLLTASFDWENNPRRAFPVVLALFLVLVPFLKTFMQNKKNSFLPIALALLGLIFCMADSLFGFYNISAQLSGQFVNYETKFLLQEHHALSRKLFSGFQTLRTAFSIQSYHFTSIQFSWFWGLATGFCFLMSGMGVFIIKDKIRSSILLRHEEKPLSFSRRNDRFSQCL